MIKSNIVLIMLMLSLLKSPEFSNLQITTNPTEIATANTTIENAETIAFNKDLKLYIGNNVSASQVKALLGIIINSNNMNNDKKITVNYNGEYNYTTNDELLIAINDIQTSATYTVSFEYSPSGFINRSIIKSNAPAVSPTPSSTPSATSSTAPENTPQTPTQSPTEEPSPTSAATPVHGDVSATVTF